MASVTQPASASARAALRNVLLEQRRFLDRLLEHVDDEASPSAGLVDLIEVLERLESRRGDLVRVLRAEASEARKRDEERSVRQFVLRALDEIGVPQNTGFLQEYVWARERVDLDTRGFGALRRDERRSWGRRPGRRLAYIVPGLDPEGRPLARWMARSDWPVEQRIIVPGGERLLDVKKLIALLDARERRDGADVADPYRALIEKYAQELLGLVPPNGDDVAEADWLAAVQRAVAAVVGELARPVDEAQRAAARRLAELPEEQQFWGM